MRSTFAMAVPTSTPEPETQPRVISDGGTIVGMPAIVPTKAERDAAEGFERLKSTTLRSVYSSAPAASPAPLDEPVDSAGFSDVEASVSLALNNLDSEAAAAPLPTPEPPAQTAMAESAPCSDAFHPERWSVPPPSGVDPIYPCEEPEVESDAQVMPALQARERLAAFAERNADSAVAEAESHAAVNVNAQASVWATPAHHSDSNELYVDEFAYIPMRRSTEDRRLLVVAAVCSGGAIVVALTALAFLF